MLQIPPGSRGSVTPWGYMGMEFLGGVNYYCILLAFILVLPTGHNRIKNMSNFPDFSTSVQGNKPYKYVLSKT